MTSDFAIETEGLEKLYRTRFRRRETLAVAGVSLRVKAGTKFGLLGANGAGKTTFVKMLVSAVLPSAGSASIFGKNICDPESRRPIGYLPENHRFPTYLTGASMLDFYGALSGMSTGDRQKRIPELLQLVGLQGWEQVRIKKYSKGMLQRLGLAQALIHRPRLLILDEPTDGVDPLGRRHIRDVLNGLLDDGVTIFINSHLLSEVETFCDDVAIIHRGKLALQGRILDLISGRGYRLVALNVPDLLQRELASFASAVAVRQERLELQLLTLEDLNSTIDRIRAAGALVESVAPTVSTLEDVFIRTTQAMPDRPEMVEATA